MTFLKKSRFSLEEIKNDFYFIFPCVNQIYKYDNMNLSLNDMQTLSLYITEHKKKKESVDEIKNRIQGYKEKADMVKREIIDFAQENNKDNVCYFLDNMYVNIRKKKTYSYSFKTFKSTLEKCFELKSPPCIDDMGNSKKRKRKESNDENKDYVLGEWASVYIEYIHNLFTQESIVEVDDINITKRKPRNINISEPPSHIKDNIKKYIEECANIDNEKIKLKSKSNEFKIDEELEAKISSLVGKTEKKEIILDTDEEEKQKLVMRTIYQGCSISKGNIIDAFKQILSRYNTWDEMKAEMDPDQIIEEIRKIYVERRKVAEKRYKLEIVPVMCKNNDSSEEIDDLFM